MPALKTIGLGWQRDLPDCRDFTLDHEEVKRLIQGLEILESLPDFVDWRPYCEGVDDQRHFNSSASHACIGLLQYCERRATGLRIDPSRLFVYKNARRLSNRAGDYGVGLRTTWKTIIRFGTATEQIWPFDPQHIDSEPDACTYFFNRHYTSIRYVRLDAVGNSGEQTLHSVKALLAAGFACVFGFPVYSSIRQDADIHLPTSVDSLIGGQAVLTIGYDDNRRHRSEKGALLVKNSWSERWGDTGFGWLPYDYVRKQLASDFWMILRPEWLHSGEFLRPHHLRLH